MKVNKLWLVICGSLAVSIAACSNGGGSSSGGGGGSQLPAMPITIDNAGTVPVLGAMQTGSVVYVHNNSNVAVSNITFTAQANSAESGMVTVNNLLDASACSAIPAGQSCALAFTSPILPGTASQTSMIITASYQINNKGYSVSNVLNFAKANNSESGVIINSGVQLSGFGNSNAYGTVYAYGGGKGNVYNVTALSNSNAGMSISQGNISGRQVASNQVQAIELTGQVPSSGSQGNSAKRVLAGIVSTLTLDSANNSNPAESYTSSVNTGVAPAVAGAMLSSGIIPLLNSATTTLGSLLIVNTGTETATLGSITFPGNITTASGSGACGSTIAAGASCTLYFNIAANTGGNGTITMPYSSPSIASANLNQNATWYAGGNDAPLLTMNSNANPLTFNATIGASNKITVVNVGSYELKSVKSVKPIVVSGSGTATIGNDVSCSDISGNSTGDKLPIGGSCSYTLVVNDKDSENGTINYGLSGNYTVTEGGQSQEVNYSRNNLFNYTSNAYSALLSLSPNPVTISTVSGESMVQVKVTNSGAALATVKKFYFGGSQYEYLTIESNTCSSVLAVNDNCTVTLNIGSPANQTTAIEGSENLRVEYSGGQANDAVATTAVNYSVLPNNEGVTATSVVAAGSESGTGTKANPFIFEGYSTGNQSVTLSLTNSGTHPIQLTKITNNANKAYWSIDYSSSSCYNGGKLPSATVAAGSSCTIVYKSALTSVQQYQASPVPDVLPITLPSVQFMDIVSNNQFVQSNISIAGDVNVNVNLYLAGITNTITQLGDVLTVTSQLTNAANYSPITVTASMESYFSGTPVPSDNCSVTSVNGNITQKCVLTPSGGTALASVRYTLNQKDYNKNTLNVSFVENTGGQVVSAYPQQFTLMLQNSPHWTPLGAGFLIEGAKSSQLVFDSAGNLYSALQDYDGNNGVWKWNGITWSQVGNSISDAQGLFALGLDPAGNIYTGGNTNSGNAAVWKYNGSTWNYVGTSEIIKNAQINSIAFNESGNLYVGVSGNEGVSVLNWTGKSWDKVTGANIPNGATIETIAFDHNGVLYAGGSTLSQYQIGYSALWKIVGESWVNLASGSQRGVINSIKFDSKNALYAGGEAYVGLYPGGALWKLSDNQLMTIGITTPTADSQLFANFYSIALGSNDHIYAGSYCHIPSSGSYLSAGCVYEWDGSKYEILGGADYWTQNITFSIPAIDIKDGWLYANGVGYYGSLWAYRVSQ